MAASIYIMSSSIVNDILQCRIEIWKALLSAGAIYISVSFLGRITRQPSTKTIITTEKIVENSNDSSDKNLDTEVNKGAIIY